MTSSFIGSSVKSRGIRNNNPGNLIRTAEKWQGKIPHNQNTDPRFEQFKDVFFGLRAMFKDLINDIKKGKNTVRLLISEYAPSHENNTSAYIEHVAKSLGVKPDQELKIISFDFLMKLGRGIVSKENRADEQALITDSMLKKAIGMVGEVSTPLVKFETKYKNSIESVLKYAIPVVVFFYSIGTVLIITQ